MKKHLPLLLTLLALLAACRNQGSDVENAALQIYNTYAGVSPTLTVAYIGNYSYNGFCYNAVMLQTDDSTEWQWVKQQFGLVTVNSQMLGIDQLPFESDSYIVTSLPPDTVGKPSDWQTAILGDSLLKATIEQITGRDFGTLPLELDTDIAIFELDPSQTAAMEQKMKSITRQNNGERYLTAYDTRQQTVWLFFCNSEQEQLALMQKLYGEQRCIVP